MKMTTIEETSEKKAPLATEENNETVELDVETGVVVEMLEMKLELNDNSEEKKADSKPEKRKSFLQLLKPWMGRSNVRPCDERENEVMVVTDGLKTTKDDTAAKEEDSKVTAATNNRLWLTRLPKYGRIVIGALIFFLVALLVAIAVSRSTRAIDIGPLITDGKFINTITSCGPIQGLIEDGAYAFRGVPYALPPVGDLRWKQAKIHDKLDHCWNGTLMAHAKAPACWQFYRNGSYDGSEDCLYVDIYTPKVHYDTPLPVVVYIGGESLGGGESANMQPSAALAKAKNVVFVSVSIRRSVLGFLSLDILSGRSYPYSSGNYGLSDLVSALTWVNVNVEHFGGDRRQVTLLGHESGGTLASALLSVNLPKALFSKVWVSGGSSGAVLIGQREAETQNAAFLKEIGCSTLDCLMRKNPEELLEAVPYEWRAFHQDLPTKNEVKHHWLIRDGILLRETSDVDVTVHTELPIVIGSTTEMDASHEMYTYLNWNDTSKFSAYLESKFGTFGTSLSREVSDRYFRPESTPWQQFASLLSDVRTTCPLYYFTTFLANQYQRERAYFYVATQRRMTSMGFVADASADISAILNKYQPAGREEELFVRNMQNLFYTFVESAKFPNDLDVTKSIYLVDENVKKIFTYPNCDFWHQHNFYPLYARID